VIPWRQLQPVYTPQFCRTFALHGKDGLVSCCAFDSAAQLRMKGVLSEHREGKLDVNRMHTCRQSLALAPSA
jgi:hypothetical protein